MQGEREEYNTETLEKLFELTQENNVMLKKIQKYQRINTAIKIIYWVIILLSIFGAYFALQPFIASLFGGDSTAFNSVSNQSQNFPEVSNIKNIINEFTN